MKDGTERRKNMITKIIVNEMTKRGYGVKETKVMKNNTSYEGIFFTKHPTTLEKIDNSPVIRTDDIVGDSLDKTIDNLLQAFLIITKQNLINPFDLLKTKEEVLKHLTIKMQQESKENLIKKPTQFIGIEQVLSISIQNEDGTVISLKSAEGTNTLLEKFNISKEHAWMQAMENVEKQAIVMRMADIIPICTEQTDMLLLTNNLHTNGASVILCESILKKVAEIFKTTEFVVLPSSVHEWIAVKNDDTEMIPRLTSMVKEINGDKTVIKPEEILGDCAYYVVLKENGVKVMSLQ